MFSDYLSPVPDTVLAHIELMSNQTLGKKIKIHSLQHNIPKLDGVDIALIGVLENRNDINYTGENVNLNQFRKSFYQLFPGNWHLTLADLGDIEKGETPQDTYYAVKTTVAYLLKQKIIPIIIGGSQDLTYSIYRAYDEFAPMVNIVNVDKCFDLGDSSESIKNNSYIGKVIVEQPYNLFNYTTIGYQTYFNSQEEIDLMNKLYFEAYRLGEITNSISFVEPIMRDANIVSLDLRSIKTSEINLKHDFSPNGFDGREICTIARYAGISSKVSSFGVYEYQQTKDFKTTTMLMAQIVWYFIEGANFRVDDIVAKDNHFKYTVLVENEELIFFKSKATGRWWIEIPFLLNSNNKLKRQTLLPCTISDYNEACKGKIPDRWYKAYKKNSI